MDNNTKMHLFVSILLRILKSKIKCIGTREQSLLLLQCIVSSNKFKSILKKFIDHFYVKYNMDHTTSIEQVPLIFINALSKIEQMLLSATTESVEYRLFTATLPSRVVDLTNNENRNHHNHNNRLSIDSFMTDSTMSDTTQTMSSSCSVSTVSSIPSQSSDSILLNRANYSQNHGNIHRAEQQNNFMSPLANSNQLSLPSLPSLQQTNMNTMNNNGYNVMNLQNNINIMNGLTTPINTNMLNVNPLNINNNPNINMNMMGLLNMMNNNANMVNNGNNINMNQVFNNNQIPSMGLLNTTNMNMNMMSQNPNINTNIPNINMIPITNNLINPTMSNMNTNNNNNNVNVMEALNIMNMVNNSSDNNNTTNITPASNSTTPTPTDSIMEVKDPETNKMVKYKIISFNPLVIEKIAVKDNEKETTQIKESKTA